MDRFRLDRTFVRYGHRQIHCLAVMARRARAILVRASIDARRISVTVRLRHRRRFVALPYLHENDFAYCESQEEYHAYGKSKEAPYYNTALVGSTRNIVRAIPTDKRACSRSNLALWAKIHIAMRTYLGVRRDQPLAIPACIEPVSGKGKDAAHADPQMQARLRAWRITTDDRSS
ncbi:hypothetical protein [Caballeronia calidae]|uniref:hypothetical protein n=1 Tax=Caballeronia calidae TaxID=1777139 RepID=UPI0012FDFA2E|nr:hypothetical protein [Caballeronia calidae]